MSKTTKELEPSISSATKELWVLQDAPNASVARLFHRGGSRTIRESIKMLREALDLARQRRGIRALFTGAGLVFCEGRTTDYRLPEDEDFAKFRKQAQASAETIRRELHLNPGDPALVVGIDIWADSQRSESANTGQFAALITHTGVELVAKGLPTYSEQAYVFVPPDNDHVVSNLALFVCHDINAYSLRGAATTADGSDRQRWREEILNQVRQAAPSVALHLSHYMNKPGSFSAAYNEFLANSEEHQCTILLGATGLPLDCSNELALTIAANLKRPFTASTLDLWV